MKKDPPNNDKKILKFILEQQLPDARVTTSSNGTTTKSSSSNNSTAANNTNTTNGDSTTSPMMDGDAIAVTAVDHVTQVALETCRCTHLQEHLPHLLDLELCKAVHHPRGWFVANPVHSLHVQTQLEDSVPAPFHNKQPPVLYGEEQQRTMALNTEGIVEYWCPLDGYSAVIHDDTAMEKMEHMPTLQNIHKATTTAMSTTTASSTTSHAAKQQQQMPPPTARHAQFHSKIPSLTTSSMNPPPPPSTTSSGGSVHSGTSEPLADIAVAATSTSLPPPEAPKSSGVVSSSTEAVPEVATTAEKDLSKPDAVPSTKGEESTAPMQVDDDPPPSTDTPPVTTNVNEGETKQEETAPDSDKKDDHDKPKEEKETDDSARAVVEVSSSTATDVVVVDTSNEEEVKLEKKTPMDETKSSGESNEQPEPVEEDPSKEEKPATSGMESSSTTPKQEEETSEQDNKDETPEDSSVKDQPKIKTEDDKAATAAAEDSSAKAKGEEEAKEEDGSSKKEETSTKPEDDSNRPVDDSSKVENPPAADASGDDVKPALETSSPVKMEEEATKDDEGDKMHIDVPAPTNEGTKSGEQGVTPAPVPSSGDGAPEPPSATPVASSPSTKTSISGHGVSSPDAVFIEEVPLALPEERFNHLRIEEDRIRLIRRSLSSHRIVPKKKVDPKKRVDPKKKRKREDLYKTPGIPGWHASNLKELTREQEDQWLEAQAASRIKVEGWMEKFRACRETFWDERLRQKSSPPPNIDGAFYLPAVDKVEGQRCCDTCSAQPDGDRFWDGKKKSSKPRRRYCGDDIMQCLECGFVGCSPQSICRDSKQHILQHLLISGHKFAVSCGERGQLFCFCCGDFVYHEVFEQEKARIDYGKKMPLMAWKPHQLYRSFDPFHFMKTQDHGIVWRGLVATYPQLVPIEHIRATEATLRRQALFKGEVEAKWLASRPSALTFAASQSLLEDSAKHKITSPVGMYNLGNTCYKSAVLQCLVHCQPLQRFFLEETGHHHHACKLYRQREATRRKKKKTLAKPEESICLACEMDKLFLAYYGSNIGVDVPGAVEESCNMDGPDAEMNDALEQGDPLVITEMLTASWKTDGMNSLVGYKQHDSHEFLNSFLEMVGKQTKQHWVRVQSAINVVTSDNALVDDENEYPQGTCCNVKINLP